MNAEIRASCPRCGQHYATDPSWQGRALTCAVCHSQFTIPPVPPLQGEPSVPAAPLPSLDVVPPSSSKPREGGLHQPLGTLCGLATPIVVLLITALLRFLGPIGLLFAAVAIPYVSHRFARWYLSRYGRAAFGYYLKAAGTAFVLLPIVGIAVFLSLADEAAGLVIVPVAFGAFVVSGVLAVLWLAGAQWFGPKE